MAQNGPAWHTGRSLLADEGPPLPPHVQAGLAVGVVVVIAIAGVMSGLTLGLLSMDRLDLELMLRTGSKKQERFARRLAPIISQPHWVLSTLVICNTAAGMALPLCLDRLVNVVVALVLSTTAIVLFGEILPQAVCSRYGLSIGGHAAPVVRLLMWATAPVSWPISKALDALLGKEQPVFGKRQISALVDLHRESAGMGGPLNEEEAHVIQGVLDLSSKTGFKAMTPLEKVFMLSTNDILDRPTLKRILDSGHSRVPVYRGSNRHDILGLILVKELLAVVGLSEPGSGPVRVRDLRIRDLPALPLETPMTDLLNLFQTGHSHMALLLQKQDSISAGDAGKNAGAPTITAVASCSSSSEGGSAGSPAHGASCCSSRATNGSGKPKSNPVATLLRSLSGKALKHSASSRKRCGDSPNQQGIDAVNVSDTTALDGTEVADAAAARAAAADRMEAGALQMLQLDDQHADRHFESTKQSSAIAAAATATSPGFHSPPPHAASAPGLSGRPPTPLPPVAGLARGSGQPLGRTSAADVWREAGWDAAGGVPVGIITLEDVLEELMQEEIVDETDAFIDNEKTCRVNARVLAMSLPPGLRRLLLTSQQLQQQRQQTHQQQQQQQGSAGLTSYSSSPHLSGGSVILNPGTAVAVQQVVNLRASHTGLQGRVSMSSTVAASGGSATAASGRGQQAMWPAFVG